MAAGFHLGWFLFFISLELDQKEDTKGPRRSSFKLCYTSSSGKVINFNICSLPISHRHEGFVVLKVKKLK